MLKIFKITIIREIQITATSYLLDMLLDMCYFLSTREETFEIWIMSSAGRAVEYGAPTLLLLGHTPVQIPQYLSKI